MAAALPLPSSLWAATATPAPPTPPLRGEAACDICIVGGGFTGLSAALHLAEAGRDLLLLEAGEPGWGASGRNGGQVIAGLKYDPDELVARFGRERGERIVAIDGAAPDLVFELIARHRIDCDAERKGWIQAVHGSGRLDLARRRVAQWQARGAPVEFLDRAALSACLGTDAYPGGWLDRRGGTLQPLSYARGLARAALAAGARLHGGSAARALESEGAGWRVATAEGTVRARAVLLCTNGYTGPLLPGLQRTVVPVNSFQAATAPLPDRLRRSILPAGIPVSDTRRLLAYFRLDRDGRLIMGGRGAPSGEADPRRYRHVRARATALFPQLGEPPWQFHWSGRVALTADHLPHLHEPAPGLHAALGYNGRGVAMATMMGRLLAERLLGAPPEVFGLPVTPIRPLPFWRLRGPALAALTRWYRLRDALETR